MLVAIISDSHDNIANLDKFLDWANKNGIERIIHCGDLSAPGTLKNVLAPKFKGKIYLIHGNVSDRELLPEVAKNFPNIEFFGDQGEIEIDGKRIAFVHRPEEARALANKNHYDFIFYGHTHEPWEEKIGQTRLVNPGTLAGMFNRATFAVYDTATDKLELKLLETL
jgi:putative phosphoesterase